MWYTKCPARSMTASSLFWTVILREIKISQVHTRSFIQDFFSDSSASMKVLDQCTQQTFSIFLLLSAISC